MNKEKTIFSWSAQLSWANFWTIALIIAFIWFFLGNSVKNSTFGVIGTFGGASSGMNSTYSSYQAPDENIFQDAILMESGSIKKELMGRSFSKEMIKSFRPPIAMADDGLEIDISHRKIVKNASMTIEVANTADSLALAKSEVKKLGGLITHQNSWEARPRVLSYNLTIRVPIDNLDKLTGNLEKIGIKKSENYSSKDITAQYADTEAEIENLKTSRDTLRGLMEKKSDELGDYLQIYRELMNVQGRIDRLTKNQKHRDDQVAFSTLQLSLQPEPKVGDLNSPDWNVEKTWKNSLNDLIRFSQEMLDKTIGLIVFAPYWLLAFIIIYLVRRRFKKNSKK